MLIVLICALCVAAALYVGGPLFCLALVPLSALFVGQAAWLRTSRFSIVTALMFQRPSNAEQFAVGDSSEPVARIFVVEPHGMLCCGLSLMVWPGDRLPASMVHRLRVVAHWSAFLVPIIGLLYRLGGMVPNRHAAMRACLAAGDSLAVSPSGIAGKEHAVRCPDTQTTILRRNRVPGAVRLAVECGVELVPVLVPDGNGTLAKPFGPCRWLPWWLVPVWGRYGLLPLPDRVDVLFGDPLRLRDNEPAEEFADRLYASFESMAPAGRRVSVVAPLPNR